MILHEIERVHNINLCLKSSLDYTSNGAKTPENSMGSFTLTVPKGTKVHSEIAENSQQNFPFIYIVFIGEKLPRNNDKGPEGHPTKRYLVT